MPQFTEQEFFGGAIRGVVPQGWIDSSTLREVPDHQELWLSPTTLSNLIIEINQRVPQAEALSTYATLNHQQPTAAPGSGSAAPATAETVDQAAALYHLHDLCDEGDTMQVIKSPTRVEVQLASSSPTPASAIKAYRGVVSFTTPVRGSGAGRVPASAEGSAAGVADAGVLGSQMNGESSGLPQVSRLTCHFLLVRLEAQETDLLVFFNVPHEEFDKNGDPRGLSLEEVVAEETIGALVGKLEICDWGLFV
ncbi:Mog1/PsbP, alpha/beta/alpha sandwich [Penicillium griseofulvum]|uniref:Mog1/PsbP, alpha/beta/alpha sandwich n=1 Tax=Penicillium patulum TaxID=5078 RepID=A0A135LVR2_PENPA|nr:Mog1/PsbP, alpha/beta/alpha sandwich [Penicillium griseofulvum]KXG53029.1 Mog1/PsbP, alpha/beta/alpha sandwich [Penicillium griseofulvum]